MIQRVKCILQNFAYFAKGDQRFTDNNLVRLGKMSIIKIKDTFMATMKEKLKNMLKASCFCTFSHCKASQKMLKL
jgi:hypothetical protein